MTNHLKKLTILLVLLLGTSGCLNPHPSNRPPQTLEDIAQRVENTAHLGAVLAFQLESVKSHKDQVCIVIQQTCEVLENINNPDITFNLIKDLVLDQVLLSIENENVRNASAAVLTIVFNETFHYVETHYNNFLEQDKTKTVLVVSNAISQGLKQACDGL